MTSTHHGGQAAPTVISLCTCPRTMRRCVGCCSASCRYSSHALSPSRAGSSTPCKDRQNLFKKVYTAESNDLLVGRQLHTLQGQTVSKQRERVQEPPQQSAHLAQLSDHCCHSTAARPSAACLQKSPVATLFKPRVRCRLILQRVHAGSRPNTLHALQLLGIQQTHVLRLHVCIK